MESEGEQSSLRRLLKLKNHELANIRKLAQEVLSHRSDVEAFLLSSIHQVQSLMVTHVIMSSAVSMALKGTSEAMSLGVAIVAVNEFAIYVFLVRWDTGCLPTDIRSMLHAAVCLLPG